ncbi:hypothetical protein CTI12_AA571480 [Artemisia annua]|uniref:Uncharacterized protein n=1 Tax=Artemisia annua TaxID=35608 RepID=A0A2U1KRX7_ARTAN|nr:hypothetical protein CTI12_AA571480 [Artemisia annua]
MVTTEEMRLKSKTQALSTNVTSSSPTVLLTEGNTTRRKETRDTRPNKTRVKPQLVLAQLLPNINAQVAPGFGPQGPAGIHTSQVMPSWAPLLKVQVVCLLHNLLMLLHSLVQVRDTDFVASCF